MKTNTLLIFSLFAVASMQGETIDQQQQQVGANKGAKARVQTQTRVQTQGRSQISPRVRTQSQNPAFYRRSTAANPTFQSRINRPTLNNRVYTRGQVQHFNLSNAANPRITSARFNAGARIAGSERWQGHNYAAFRSYHPQWHDHNWWRSHHNRIVLIGGGYYFWDNGWWYPAWGYDNAYSYYPYDGPIYAYNDLPPDQVVANVQTALQQEGYYQGEVDGLLGPLTRAALADYQRDHGLYTTAAIDQPTLASLGMG
jgi:putative peptidoglycan binding protein